MIFEVETQLSVRIENTPGAIARLSNALAERDIDLKAVSINEGETGGYFRFTVCNPVAAKQYLEEQNYQVKIDDVLSIRLQDSKGKLAYLTKAFSEGGVNIDYIYASVDQAGAGSRLIVKVSNIHLAIQVLNAILQVA